MTKNIVIYARYSSHNQTEQSIEGQLKVCYEFAERNEYNVIEEYIDRALSGTTDKREEFQRMIDDSARKQFEYVLVYQLDRFARNRYDSAIYKGKLKKNGIRVLSVKENITDDASGILVEGVFESLAEYYSAELSQKIKRGMDVSASKCLATGGNVALGYYVDQDKHFQIDNETAPLVQKIFEMYTQGHIMAEITKYLNSLNIKTSRGNEFNKNSIRHILSNKRYKGIYTYNGMEIEDGMPRVISDELFDEAQKLLDKNKKAPARSRAKAEYILTTKLFCGMCESMMTGISGTSKSSKKYHYYACVQARNKKCDKRAVQKDFIEDLVVKETKKLLTDKNIDKIAREVVAYCQNDSNSITLQRLKKSLKENEKATENLFKALDAGELVGDITQRIIQKKAEHIEIEKQIAQEGIKYPSLTIPQVKFFMERFKKGNINDLKYRKSLIDVFVNKVVLYDDKITVLYNTQDGQETLSLEGLCSSNGTMVEAAGVEPASENPSIQFSPSAVDHLNSLYVSPVYKDIHVGSFIKSGSLQSLFEFVLRTMAPAPFCGLSGQTFTDLSCES